MQNRTRHFVRLIPSVHPQVATVYMCSRLVVNVSQSYLPLYLTETLKFEKVSHSWLPARPAVLRRYFSHEKDKLKRK